MGGCGWGRGTFKGVIAKGVSFGGDINVKKL